MAMAGTNDNTSRIARSAALTLVISVAVLYLGDRFGMLGEVMNLISQGVTFLGGVLIVFGLVNLGMTVKDGIQGGGGQLAGAIAMIVGGGIVIGAAIYFGTLDTSFAG